jgi:hypothetical protein
LRPQGFEWPPRRLRYVYVALGLMVVLAPHALGGAYAWSTAASGSVACLTLAVLALTTNQIEDDRWGREPFVWLLLLMLLATVLPAIPLPVRWLAQLRPNVLAHHLEVIHGLGLPAPNWLPLSQDPGNTHERIAFGVAVTATFCAARTVAILFRSTPILIAVAVSTIAIAWSHLGHQMFAARAVYGVYVPSFTAATGPLLNPNHLAGFMALGSPLCIGLGLRSQGVQRWLWWAGCGVVSATGLLAASRAGTAMLVAGPVLFAVLQWWRGRRDQRLSQQEGRRRARRSPGSLGALEIAGLVSLIAAVSYGLADSVADDFVDTNYRDLTKLELFRTEFQAIFRTATTPWLGVGRGAFAVAFAEHYVGPERFLFAECLPLQYALEFGVPLAAVFCFGALWRVSSNFWRWRSPGHLGGIIGVFVLTLQNLVDYSLEMSGIALPAAACLAAALPPVGEPRGRWPRLFPLRSGVRIAAVLCGALIAVVGVSACRSDSLWLERKLSQYFKGQQSAEFWTLLRRATLAHPSAPSFATFAAGQAVMERSPQAAFWLNRAMSLAPLWGRPHLWAAHWLIGLGRPEQALTELALAAESNPKETAALLCERLKATPTASIVLSVAPRVGRSRTIVLDGGARCLAAAPDEASRVDEVILSERPDDVDARARRVRRTLVAGDYRKALEEARLLRRLSPQLADAYLTEAEALQGLQAPEDAIQALRRGSAIALDRRAVLTSLAWSHVTMRDELGLRQTVDQLRMEAGGNARKQAATMLLLGQCEAALGNEARALKALREAAELGSIPVGLAAAAELAGKLGQLDFAREAWGELCERYPKHPRYCSALEALTGGAGSP